MKVSCLQENLAHGLSIVGRAVAARSTLPILGNILLATENGRLKLAATNQEIGITHWMAANIQAEGAITVPARLLTDFVNSLPPEKVEMELNARTQTLNLKCARSNANIKGIDPADFPLIPTLDGENKISIHPDVFKDMVEQVIFASATDDSRPVLTGVLAKFDGDAVTLEAADGFRLSVRRAALAEPVARPVRAIIPSRALAEVSRLCGDLEAPVELAISEKRAQALFRAGTTEIVSMLLEGNFPDLTQIIPKNFSTRTVVNTAELQRAVKTASVFARDASNIVRLSVSSDNEAGAGHMVVAASGSETGDNVDEIDATMNGSPIEIAFNARYLSDVLNVLHAPQVALETNSSAAPGLFRPVGRDDYTHVIMPMHLNRE